jgi:DNA adenine methylase
MTTTEVIESARADLVAQGLRPTTCRIMAKARSEGFPLTPHQIKRSSDDALECGASSAALECYDAASVKSLVGEQEENLFMPQGVHSICPSQNGQPCPVTIVIDSDSADALEQQWAILTSIGKNPFFSIQHSSEIAAFWPSRFSWDTRMDATGKRATGVWADGEWSASGKAARDGKDFRSFSGTFHVNDVRADPCVVICQSNARADMGAIEDDPAFGSAMSPLWARDAGGFPPLIEIWQTLRESPETLKQWHAERWEVMMAGDKVSVFERVKASYNSKPNGADLLFICRSCYRGVVRFRQRDGYISTPCGIHQPIHPDFFATRVDTWRTRVAGTRFFERDYSDALRSSKAGDLIYCDPPYSHTQAILYGAQSFSLKGLLTEIQACKSRGVFVALSIDGTKKSGNTICDLPIPKGLFEREVFLHCGRSMLRRFQMNGQTLEAEHVTDRLLLTY